MIKWNVIWVIFTVVLLSGCWDQHELSDISVVMGMAVDKSNNGKFALTVEGINAQELDGKTATGFTPSIVFTLEGNTISELTQKLNIGVSKHVIYSHMRTLIIGEDVAKEGIDDFLDYLERDREVRDDFNILVAHGVKAAEILSITYPIQKSSSLKLHAQLKSMVEHWGGDPDVRLNNVVQALASPGRQPVMAAVSIKGNPKSGESVDNLKKVRQDAIVILDSLAVFNQDKLQGFLSLEDARNLLWIQDKLKKTAVSVPCNKNDFFGLRVYNSKTRIKARMEKGTPVIKLKIRAEAYLDGMQCKNDLTSVKTYDKFENLTEAALKKQVRTTIQKSQDEFGLDIFGFGEAIYRQDYQDFKKVSENWDESFKNAIVDVQVRVKIRRSGIRTKSLISNEK
ncbi:Ger(x)C family spore germination protein [Neobacillus mesonae]|uniref:Spore gernimation protein GerC n=1 Tax=Neobacillus mesonae TaxID=1193713 RepID=A0A3Q9QTZ1_9BACI|nr:Ger(x)C family spore germination protein [Neobacillus mesonae]AZU61308.1 spore gernimation protein GerC [Neobacillus mesonae]